MLRQAKQKREKAERERKEKLKTQKEMNNVKIAEDKLKK